jgi:quercetin dioxygenase-like cupin family protein
MAKIYLEEKECFEHFHDEISETTLLEGEALYEIDGTEKKLLIGETVVTPAKKSHTVSNIGKSVVIFYCGSFSVKGEKMPHR